MEQFYLRHLEGKCEQIISLLELGLQAFLLLLQKEFAEVRRILLRHCAKGWMEMG